MADAENKAEEKPATAAPAGGGSKLVPLLLVMNSVLLAAVLAVLVLKPGGLKHTQAEGAEGAHGAPAEADGGKDHGEKGKDGKGGKDAKEALPGPTVRLPDFIVHLRDADADRYARLSFEMELPDEKAKEGINARLPQIRDGFLSYLSDCTAEDLRGSDAIVRVKTALAKKLGEVAPGVPVRGLYITELVVQ
jgi:flagellar FliL protein